MVFGTLKISLNLDLTNFSNILPQAGQLMELSETDYRSGETSFLDLIDTQRSILRYQLELAHAEADSQIHLASIEMMIGKELTDEK